MSRNPPLRLRWSPSPVRVAVRSRNPDAQSKLEDALRGTDGIELPESGHDVDVLLWDAGLMIDSAEASSVVANAIASDATTSTPVVAIIARREDADVAIDAGARGVVMRDQVGTSLLPALSAARHGLRVLDARLAAIQPPRETSKQRHDASPMDSAESAVAPSLTPREHQVLSLMADGLSNKQIGSALGISSHTAKFHASGLLLKLDADTRTEAVVTAVRAGLLAL